MSDPAIIKDVASRPPAPAGSTAHVVTVTDSDGDTVINLQPTLEAARAYKNRIKARCERFNMKVKICRLEEVQ